MSLRVLRAVLAVLAGAAFAVGALVGVSAAGPPGGTPVFSFTDDRILESSALVASGRFFVTVNDSGGGAHVFTVDPATGDTVGVTDYGGPAVDDESLAPAGPGHVWVGDTGDNLDARRTITVTRVPVGRGERTVAGSAYQLVYPDGAHDAETLLRDPRTGRLYVVSKEFIGHLYAAPRHLHAGINRLRAGRSVLGIATDGSFFPDGRHVVLRNYGQAAFYTWPAMHRIATVDLPDQPQGEGIAVDAHDRVFLSSEGEHSEVLRLQLPAHLQRELAGDRAGRTAQPATTSPSGSVAHEAGDGDDGFPWPWALGGVAGVVVIGVLIRSLRPR